jgi:hypothetical protein
MSASLIAIAVFACTFGGALLGMWLRGALPGHHLSEESKDVVKLGMGLIATMTALVLGLVTASAKSAFDEQDAAIKRMSVSVLALDRTLARYGPETKPIRDLLRSTLAYRLETTWPEDSSRDVRVETLETTPTVEGIEDAVRNLTPQTDAQRAFQSRALAATSDLLDMRWSVFGSVVNAIPTPFLVIVVLWLAVIFWSFGLFAPRNATVVAVLVLCALSVAAAILLILEMERPYDGIMKISSAPLRFTLAHLGQ